MNGTAQSTTSGNPSDDGQDPTELPATPGAKPKALTAAQVRAALVMEELCAGVTPCAQQAAFTWGQDEAPQDDADPAPAGAARIVTITDVARFLPAAAVLHAEPNGWAVVGVPANFWVEATPVTVDGALLGETAQVRFTPRGYRFAYGDGVTRTAATAGASWAALGQDELTDTATSHIYTARADGRAGATVYYSAEYRFAGGPWIGIAGAVAGQAPPVRELVVVERTALTAPTTG